ncbi:hypothetical protein HPG69_017128 [Diceros bicornis minor]|uniref:Uncharacterized protein n=1 Tax=Diceros bicornis minor TaxID=77932 RepID=A0A7J7ECH3_DICBM|nr:hypothetical protein HPG69_017128 [Diceros bicornis minor]
MEHRPKVVDIPNSSSKPSEKELVVSPEPQKSPADLKMKTSSQTKKKKQHTKSPIALLVVRVMGKNYVNKKGFMNSLPCLRIVTVVMTSSLGKSFFVMKEGKNDKNKSSAEARKFESVLFQFSSGSKSSVRNYGEQQALKRKLHIFGKMNLGSRISFFKNTKQQFQVPLHPPWEASKK